MPNTARLALTALLPRSRVIPPFTVSGEKRQGWGWLSDVRGFALLVLLCLTLYAPRLASIPPVDRDEARFAQATRQMLETGDFIQIRFQREARNKKSIGINWLQAASVALFSAPGSTAIWPYRLPSALAATIAVLLTSVLGATLLSSRGAGFVAGIVMASGLGLVVEAHLAKTDAVLLAAVVAGQLALGIMYVRVRGGAPVHRRLVIAFWTAHTVDRRPRHSLDQSTATDPRSRPDNAVGYSLVRSDRTSGEWFSCRIALAEPTAEASQCARITWCSAGVVPRVVAREFLAGLAVSCSGCVLGLATATCSGAAVPDRLAVAGLDPL
jgi:hypothetical protein